MLTATNAFSRDRGVLVWGCFGPTPSPSHGQSTRCPAAATGRVLSCQRRVDSFKIVISKLEVREDAESAVA